MTRMHSVEEKRKEREKMNLLYANETYDYGRMQLRPAHPNHSHGVRCGLALPPVGRVIGSYRRYCIIGDTTGCRFRPEYPIETIGTEVTKTNLNPHCFVSKKFEKKLWS